MYCPKCGFNNFNGAEICGGCGMRLGGSRQAQQPQRMNPHSSGTSYPPRNGGYMPNGSTGFPQYPQGYGAPNGKMPGKGSAVASLVLGIVSVVAWFFNVFAIIGLITGIVGIICSVVSKKAGYIGGIRTAGFVLSIIGTVGAGIVFIACISCAATYGGLLGGLSSLY